MGDEMNREEMDEFLGQKLLARVATVKPDGSPHVTPVWYYWDGEILMMNTSMTRRKAVHLQNDPRIAVTIDTTEQPYRRVIMEGEAELSQEDGTETIVELAGRYMGEQGRGYAKNVLAEQPRVTVRLKPEKVITWDGSK